MSAQRKRNEKYEMETIVEEVHGKPYEYLPLGKYVVVARGVGGGRPTIKYHRLDARDVLARVNGGMPVRQVAREYSIPVAAVTRTSFGSREEIVNRRSATSRKAAQSAKDD